MITNQIIQVNAQLKQVTQMFKDILAHIPEDQLHHLYTTLFPLRDSLTDLEDKVAEKFKEFIDSLDPSASFKEDLGTLLKAERESEAIQQEEPCNTLT